MKQSLDTFEQDDVGRGSSHKCTNIKLKTVLRKAVAATLHIRIHWQCHIFDAHKMTILSFAWLRNCTNKEFGQ